MSWAYVPDAYDCTSSRFCTVNASWMNPRNLLNREVRTPAWLALLGSMEQHVTRTLTEEEEALLPAGDADPNATRHPVAYNPYIFGERNQFISVNYKGQGFKGIAQTKVVILKRGGAQGDKKREPVLWHTIEDAEDAKAVMYRGKPLVFFVRRSSESRKRRQTAAARL